MLDPPHRALVSLPGNNGHMAWSPASLFLAFCAEFKHRKFITVSDLTGHSWLVAEIDGDCKPLCARRFLRLTLRVARKLAPGEFVEP